MRAMPRPHSHRHPLTAPLSHRHSLTPSLSPPLSPSHPHTLTLIPTLTLTLTLTDFHQSIYTRPHPYPHPIPPRPHPHLVASEEGHRESGNLELDGGAADHRRHGLHLHQRVVILPRELDSDEVDVCHGGSRSRGLLFSQLQARLREGDIPQVRALRLSRVPSV